jgi:hypothetical protein
MGAAKALKALAAVPENKRTEKINNKIGEISEYFLKHHIYKKSHDISKIARPGWLKLGFPLMYQTDILELSEILAGLKLKDGRMDDALETIRKKQMNDGRWKLENSFNGKLTVDIEKKGMPSKWITLKALKALEIYR